MRARFILLCLLGNALNNRADVAMVTQHNDLARTGANLNETVLNVANVNTNAFGLLYTRPVDDQVYAQPLIMTNVTIPGWGVHNVLYVATVNDTVYAYDADDSTVTNPYWTVSFLTSSNIVAPNNADILNLTNNTCQSAYANISGNFGIVGTPVIDPGSGTLYVLARTKEYGSDFVQRLHALDISTGTEQPNSPVEVAASVPGTGDASAGGLVSFDPLAGNQRCGLALVNGVVYIAWTSHCDAGLYHGWVIGYDATNLEQVCVYNTTPNGSAGAIWMSGNAPAADAAGNLYLSTANGTVGTASDPTDPSNRGESFLKLTPTGTNLAISSWFTPYNWSDLNANDQDLASGGMLLIPGTSLAISGGKQGVLYLVNRDQMGGLSATNADTNVVQTWSLADGNEMLYSGPVWYDGPAASYLYFWMGFNDYLRQYTFDRTNNVFDLGTVISGPTQGPKGHPGAILSVSANGTSSGSAIVWASMNLVGDAQSATQPGILHAYDATNVNVELWNSEEQSARDSVGLFAKFEPPTVANGKVYLATFSQFVNVYGLLPLPALSAVISGSNVVLTWPASFSGFVLQTNASLSNAPGWGAATNQPVLVGTNYQITVGPSPQPAYFRLMR